MKLGLLIPLQNDRGGIVTAGPERAARYEVDASRSRLRQAITDAAYSTAAAYWDYVATLQRQAIYAFQFEGVRYDAGSKLGFLIATVQFALKRPDLAEGFDVQRWTGLVAPHPVAGPRFQSFCFFLPRWDHT